MAENKKAPSPLYRDPIFDGAADPCVIYHPQEKKWYMLYTQRRANVPSPDVSYCAGSQIGLAVSEDGGYYWYYLGSLDLNIEWGMHTYWAPEVIYYEGLFHMYVTRIRGVNTMWRGASVISHYTSPDIRNWAYVGDVDLASNSVIDACIYHLDSGVFRMWYRNNAIPGEYTWYADSADLHRWDVKGACTHNLPYHEGQNVFKLDGQYFLIADTGRGQFVFRSDNLETWTLQKEKLLTQMGSRTADGVFGQHSDVVSDGTNAYIFYFTHPERTGDFWKTYDECTPIDIPYRLRRSCIQVAKLTTQDGQLLCDRDQEFELLL